MTLQECLGSLEQIPDHNRASEREDEMLVIRVQDQPIDDRALEADDSLELKLYFGHFPASLDTPSDARTLEP
jgi:hypothetical protein